MPALPPFAVEAALVLAALVLLLFVWRSVAGLPLAARVVLRLVLAAVVLAPFALLVLERTAPMRDGERKTSEAPRAPQPQEPVGGAPPPTDGTPSSGGEGRARDPEKPKPAPAPITTPRDAEPPRTAEAPPPPAPAPAPPPAAAPKPAEPAEKPAGEDGATRGLGKSGTGDGGGRSGTGGFGQPGATAPPAASPAPAPAPVARPATTEQQPYDVVPVYFGTDRARDAAAKRLAYTWERGRKLELGHALITVPKTHKVPLVERPWVIRIPYFETVIYEQAEDPASHFTIKEISNLTEEGLLALIRERLAASKAFANHALVFVHGYNTSFDHALYRTAQLTYDMKFDGASFLYSWPSGGKIASYTYDRESAGQSEPYLREFLDMVVAKSGATSVSIIAHSMGNQPVLQVLRELKRSAPPGVAINQVILAAPDVDRDNFENLTATIQGLAKGVTLYAAANDRALIVSRRFHGGVPRAGDVPDGGPLVLPGIDTIDVTAASTDALGLNHSSYAENNALLNDVGLLLQTGERPPDKRIPILEEAKTDRGVYWRYPLPK